MDSPETLAELDRVSQAVLDVAKRQDKYDDDVEEMRKIRHNFNDKISGIVGVTQTNSERAVEQVSDLAEHVRTVQDLAEATNALVTKHDEHIHGEADKDYPGLLKDSKTAKNDIKTLKEHDSNDFNAMKLLRVQWKTALIIGGGACWFLSESGLLTKIFN